MCIDLLSSWSSWDMMIFAYCVFSFFLLLWRRFIFFCLRACLFFRLCYIYRHVFLFFVQFLLFHLFLDIHLVLDFSSIKTGNIITSLFTLGQDTVGLWSWVFSIRVRSRFTRARHSAFDYIGGRSQSTFPANENLTIGGEVGQTYKIVLTCSSIQRNFFILTSLFFSFQYCLSFISTHTYRTYIDID